MHNHNDVVGGGCILTEADRPKGAHTHTYKLLEWIWRREDRDGFLIGPTDWR